MNRVTTLQVLWSSPIFLRLFVAFLALLPKLRMRRSYLTVYIKLFINSKWGPASAGKEKAGMVHSVSRWTWGVQVKLWDPLRTCAMPERLRCVFRMRRYTNPRLPLLLQKTCMYDATKHWHSPKCEVSNKRFSLTAWHLWLLVSFLTLPWQLSDSPIFLGFPLEFVEQNRPRSDSKIFFSLARGEISLAFLA